MKEKVNSDEESQMLSPSFHSYDAAASDLSFSDLHPSTSYSPLPYAQLLVSPSLTFLSEKYLLSLDLSQLFEFNLMDFF